MKSNGDPLFVLAKSSTTSTCGSPTSSRAEEHLPTTPKAILIWTALGNHRTPHVRPRSGSVNEKRQKLSKRRDRVAIEDYRDLRAFFPEAMRNYLVLLGWSPRDDRELLTVDEMVNEFRLEDVNKSPAFFDEKASTPFQRPVPPGDDPRRIHRPGAPVRDRSQVATWPETTFDLAIFTKMAPLIQERIATLGEIVAYVEFLFSEPFADGPGRVRKGDRQGRTRPKRSSERAGRFASASFDHETLRETLAQSASSSAASSPRRRPRSALRRWVGRSACRLFESLETARKRSRTCPDRSSDRDGRFVTEGGS